MSATVQTGLERAAAGVSEWLHWSVCIPFGWPRAVMIKEYGENATKLATLGYSFLAPFLTTGLNQDDLVNLKSLENNVLNLQKELIPLQSSHTMSGKTSSASNPTSTTTEPTIENNIPSEE